MHAIHLLPLTLFSLFASSAANTVQIRNNCGYPLHIKNDVIAGEAKTVLQSGGDPWTFDYAATNQNHHSSIKISKSDNFGKDYINQLEYTYDMTGQKIWYDISLIDCTDGKDPNAERCPGWEAGMRLSSGGSCQKYSCAPSEFCWKQVYWYAGYDGGGVRDENNQPVSPNTQCGADQGLVFDLCSG